jgi:hypothetical protein
MAEEKEQLPLYALKDLPKEIVLSRKHQRDSISEMKSISRCESSDKRGLSNDDQINLAMIEIENIKIKAF